jgi:hypothetical protein
MMKTKLKTPEIAKKNGGAFVKKLLKKLFKENIAEPTQFFYHSAFDYGGPEGPEPLLFIGDVPTAWKKWIKQNQCKTSKEFAAGRCLFDVQTKQLKLEVKMGKGGKSAVLKIIQKQLLKPFAQAIFVENVDLPVAELEDAPETEDQNTVTQMEDETVKGFNISDFINEAKAFFKEGNGLQTAINSLVNGIGSTLKDISSIVVTDEIIDEAKSAKEALFDLNIVDFVNEKLDWLNDLPTEVRDNDEFQQELQKVDELERSLKEIESDQLNLIKQCGLVEKVEAPTRSANPPISNNPLSNFGMALNKHQKTFD